MAHHSTRLENPYQLQYSAPPTLPTWDWATATKSPLPLPKVMPYACEEKTAWGVDGLSQISFFSCGLLLFFFVSSEGKLHTITAQFVIGVGDLNAHSLIVFQSGSKDGGPRPAEGVENPPAGDADLH